MTPQQFINSMIRAITIISLAILLAVPCSAKEPFRTVEGIVKKVADGDTITVISDGTKLKIRLYGIDAPEAEKSNRKTGRVSKPGQPYGEEAFRALEEKVYRQRVRLEIMDIDRYKRAVSVVWLGDPKLHNDLKNPNMEEIGYRSTIFSLDAITGSQREYIHWLLRDCSGGADPETMFTEEAIDLLASKLRTPLQVEQHLKLALEAGYQTGVKPIPVEVAESVLSKKLDDLEPTLTRHGYKMRDLAEELGVKSSEIKALFRNQLEPSRSKELQEKMLAAGLPI